MFSQRGVNVTNQRERFIDISIENYKFFSCHFFENLTTKSTRTQFIAVLCRLFHQSKSENKETIFKNLR